MRSGGSAGAKKGSNTAGRALTNEVVICCRRLPARAAQRTPQRRVARTAMATASTARRCRAAAKKVEARAMRTVLSGGAARRAAGEARRARSRSRTSSSRCAGYARATRRGRSAGDWVCQLSAASASAPADEALGQQRRPRRTAAAYRKSEGRHTRRSASPPILRSSFALRRASRTALMLNGGQSAPAARAASAPQPSNICAAACRMDAPRRV